jgi:hypothetical protein
MIYVLKIMWDYYMPLLELIVRNIARYPQSATSTPIRYQPAIRYLLPWTKHYRYWTLENFSLYKANTALQNCDALHDHDYCPNLWSSVSSKESDSLSPQGDSCVNNKVLFQEDCHDTTVVHHLLSNHEASQLDGQGIAISSPLSSYIFLYSLLNVSLGIAMIL